METRTVIDTIPWERDCVARHIGPWMVEPHWFNAAVSAVKAGMFQVQETEPSDQRLFTIDHAGIASIGIIGATMKGDSKFGGTNSIRTRQAVRVAADDNSVKAIMLHIDSPGGTAAGTAELANDVRLAGARKPVFAHIEDLGASAAFFVASQAHRITATPTSRIGSIGSVAILQDTSGAAEAAGIKVHVISTGDFKGAFVDGAPITEEHLEDAKREIVELNGHFLKAVSRGRGMSMAEVREVADGRVHIAANAMAMGLIDAVSTVDEALAFIRNDLNKARASQRKMAVSMAQARGDAAGLPL